MVLPTRIHLQEEFPLIPRLRWDSLREKRGTRQTHKHLSLELNQSFRYLTGSPPSRQGCRLGDCKTLFCCEANL